MKVTYDAYSKSAIGLKAALLPFVPVGISALCGPENAWDDLQLRTAVIMVLTGISIFFVEIFFICAFRFINKLEISSQLRHIEKRLLELNECIENCSDARALRVLRMAVVEREAERAALLSR